MLWHPEGAAESLKDNSHLCPINVLWFIVFPRLSGKPRTWLLQEPSSLDYEAHLISRVGK